MLCLFFKGFITKVGRNDTRKQNQKQVIVMAAPLCGSILNGEGRLPFSGQGKVTIPF